ncbi:MAG TPA: sphingosine kinase, partial [Acidobacteria bacterium]|nr:sphingosine kinase [Acidobacteriota bacterium]
AHHQGGLVVTRRVEDLAEQARRAAEDGIERLLVLGGDGTMHQAAQGLAGTATALGVIPRGTGNDLALALGTPRGLDEAVRHALTAPVRRIDLIRAGEAVCIGYAGAGFDSEVTHRANQVQRFRGRWIYPWAALRTLVGFQPPQARIAWDGGTFDGPVMFVDAANLPSYGGGMRIAPAARIDDGRMDLVILKKVSRATFLSVFPKVYKGDHVGHPELLLETTRRAEITFDRTLDLYGGGEFLRTVPANETIVLEMMAGGLAVAG